MADTAHLSSKELFEAMESAWKVHHPEEVIKYAKALVERNRPEDLLNRVQATIALANFTPGVGGVRHAQEAVRLVSADMRAAAFPADVFNEELPVTTGFLMKVRENYRARVQEMVAKAQKEREEADKQEEREEADEQKKEQSGTGNEGSKQ